MSTNALAIAAVTQSIKSIISNGLSAASLELGDGTPAVTASPPDTLFEPNETDRLNIYPWKVTHNAAFANECLPSHNSQGTRLSSPRLGLDMHFILTATGTDDLHAPILLGHGMQALHESPVLSGDDISAALKLNLAPADAANLPAVERLLRTADLHEQIERVKITPLQTEDEELTKLWPALNTALRMSALYKASLVLIEMEREIAEGPPVREYALTAFPLRRPQISRIVAQPGTVEAPLLPDVHPQAGTRVAIIGSGLTADDMDLWIGDTQIDLTAPGVGITEQRLSIVLPADLAAGPQLTRVEHFWTASNAPERRLREASPSAAFVVAPTVSGTPTVGAVAAGVLNGTIEIGVVNDVAEDAVARLFLTPDDETLARRAFVADPLSAPGTDLTFQVSDLAEGAYTYVLSVNGGETQSQALTVGTP